MHLIKKLAVVFSVLIALLLAAILIIPMVVNVDKYRPQIVQAADRYINGKLEIGKLSLSLWGQVRVQVDGLKLADGAGNAVVSVQDAFFHIPFTSILSGSPELTFKMSKPVVNVAKDAQGKLNVLSLVKSTPAAQTSTQAAPPASATNGGGATELPAIAARARLGIELDNANLSYKDLKTKLNTQIQDVNLRIKDISLSHPIEMELTANLDTKMGAVFSVKGPVKMNATVKPELAGNKFEKVTMTAHADLDGLEISAGGMFNKKAGLATNADLQISASEKEARIEKLDAKFFNAELTASGAMTNLGGTTSPVIRFSMKSNEIDLKSWSELVPMLKDFQLAGNAHLSAEADGPTDRLGYKADLGVSALTAKAPMLKVQPRFDASIHIITDQVEKLELSMKAPGNDFRVTGKIVDFLKPQITMDVSSTGLDLDQLIDLPPLKSAQAAPPAEKPAQSSSGGATAPASDYDAMLDSLRQNKSALETSVAATVGIKFIKIYDVKMSEIGTRFIFKNLAASIEKFKMGVFGGNILASFSTQLKPKIPAYQFDTAVTGLDLKEAVASQFQLFKNTVLGKANFDMKGQGSSFNPTPAMQNLNAKGKMKIDNATFATVDVGKMTTDALNKGIERVAEKVPAAKGKAINKLPGKEMHFDSISSDFVIDKGKFSMPNFLAKASPNQGIDIKGSTTVGLIDHSLSTQWELVDTYNLTKAKDISVDLAGTHVDHLLAEGTGPVKFPVHAEGTTAAPVYSYTQVPEYLAKVAADNVAHAATAAVKGKVASQAQQVLQKAPLPPAVQNKVQDFAKKLFH